MRRAFASLTFAVLATGLLALPAAGARAGRPTAPTDRCGPGLVSLGGGLCTHGGDLVPGQVQRIAARAPAPAGTATSDLCASDGVRGRRIRVYYGYPIDTAPRAAMFRSWIRESVAIADSNIDAATPGVDGQHLRMYCKDDTEVTVNSIELLPIGGDGTFTFDDVIWSLVDRAANGLGKTDIDISRYTYVVFVDNITCCYGPAGQGTIYYDDRADPAVNFNNRAASGPRFALVEIGGGSTFAGSFVFLHEVGHTLGAVQNSAPHASGYSHCYTSSDVMCYADGGPYFTGGGTMQAVCAELPPGQFTFDCEGGDYYEIDPAPGSYLASAWNVSDSGWLTKSG